MVPPNVIAISPAGLRVEELRLHPQRRQRFAEVGRGAPFRRIEPVVVRDDSLEIGVRLRQHLRHERDIARVLAGCQVKNRRVRFEQLAPQLHVQGQIGAAAEIDRVAVLHSDEEPHGRTARLPVAVERGDGSDGDAIDCDQRARLD